MMDAEIDWPPFNVTNSRKRVEELLNNMIALNGKYDDVDEYALPELARMLVVRCSGHLEVTFSECFLAFVSRHSKSTISNYVNKTFKNWQNPKPETILKALKNIDSGLRQDFYNFLNADSGILASDIGAMVTQRCKVSHGDNDQVTFKTAQRYYESALVVSDWIIDCFKPNGKADAASQK